MKLGLTLLIIVCAALYGVWDTWRPMPSRIAPAQTEKYIIADLPNAPNFTFATLDGTSYDVQDFRGKTVVLNFWATWCAPCIAEFPDLLHIAQERSDDLVLLALSVDQTADVITPFFKRFDAQSQTRLTQDNVKIVHDAGKKISQDLFQSIRYPETYIINPAGQIVRKVVGALTEDDIQSLLSATNS